MRLSTCAKDPARQVFVAAQAGKAARDIPAAAARASRFRAVDEQFRRQSVFATIKPENDYA